MKASGSAVTMTPMANRFRGFLPVVVDVETGGFDWTRDALLEVAAVLVDCDEDGVLRPGAVHRVHVQPFEGANIDPKALEVNGIDPAHPLRPALPEKEALQRIFRPVRQAIREYECSRAILVGHNSFFDLHFLNAAADRCTIKRNPFHPFSSFDTVTLGGALLGQTVLARAMRAADLPFDTGSAHSAAYDAESTAKLFCLLVNRCGGVYESFANK